MFCYQPENCHHPDTGRKKKGGRDAAWCNPSEDHHASRLNNVFPMPCQTFSRLWAARQPLQPHSMKHPSFSVRSETASLIRISPLRFLRGDTRSYVSWMFTSSLYLVSGETCVCGRAGDSHRYYASPRFTWINNTDCGLRPRSNCTSDLISHKTLVWSTAEGRWCKVIATAVWQWAHN